MAHNEAEVQCFFTISSYASHSLQWMFLQVFNIDCSLVLIFFSFWREMTTINLCI